MENFVNKYSLSKTLRFELIPQGKTKEYIDAKGLLKQDADRADSYQKVKKIIDAYHKYFIELAMDKVQLSKLEEFRKLYFAPAEKKKEEVFKKEFEKIQEDLRKEILIIT